MGLVREGYAGERAFVPTIKVLCCPIPRLHKVDGIEVSGSHPGWMTSPGVGLWVKRYPQSCKLKTEIVASDGPMGLFILNP